MITRIWHGRTGIDNSQRYLEFLLGEGTREYQNTKGNLSVKVWKKNASDCCHFYTVTEWESVEAIKAFAGDDYEKAVYYPFDKGMLLEFEEKVTHFETFVIRSSGTGD